MDTRVPGASENLWNAGKAEGLSPVEALAHRSNLLGSDRSVANYGGGNTSTKAKGRDHAGREVDVLWVKGSGSDLATIRADQFTGLKLDEVSHLEDRDEMSDEEMVAYLASCQLRPDMPRGSIETLLHAFVPYPQVDHTHPDAINMICCAEGGEELARECFGEEAVWIPYIRPGFILSKQVGEAVRNNPGARFVLLAKHGLVTWGETHEESYGRTIEAINRAAEFVAGRAGEPFGGRAVDPTASEEREALLAEVLPALRGALSLGTDGAPAAHKILRVDHVSDEVLQFVCGRDSRELSQVGAACPDHLVRTKVRPLWVDFDPETEGADDLKAKLREGVEAYRREYEAYFSRHEEADEEMFDPNPRVVLIRGLGLVAAAQNAKEADLSRDFAYRAMAVMRGAHALGGYVSLTEEESYAIEYWPMELYKLTLAPPPKELAGRVAFVTGGAGGIGSAVARSLAAEGACVVACDLDEEGTREVVEGLPQPGIVAKADVRSEDEVARAYRRAVPIGPCLWDGDDGAVSPGGHRWGTFGLRPSACRAGGSRTTGRGEDGRERTTPGPPRPRGGGPRGPEGGQPPSPAPRRACARRRSPAGCARRARDRRALPRAGRGDDAGAGGRRGKVRPGRGAGGCVSTDRVVYGGLLVAAAFWAVLSAVLLLGAPYEGDRARAWFWGACFALSSFASALCFWELL